LEEATPANTMQNKILVILCVCILLGILTAGLWPFHAPRNQVSWLSGGTGLHFGVHGLILSADSGSFAGLQDGTSCSIEIWMKPDFSDIGGTILAFYIPENRNVAFSVHQSIDDLFLRHINVGAQKRTKNKFYIEHAFRNNTQLFVTITANPQGTTVYINGVLVRTSPQFGLSSKDLAGQIVVGNYPLVDNGWQGQVMGLAIYNRDLTAAQVSQHYDRWMVNRQAEIRDQAPVALYFFHEGMGTVVHEQMNSGIDLHIPEHYFVLHAPFLRSPWDEFDPSWSYVKNVLINIGGFVPLGFFFCAYFSSVRHFNRVVLATIVVGALISLTIEVLQSYLPTRDSGMTDIITNTLGTGIGAALCTGKFLVRLRQRLESN
jgi:hypothetical protein